MKKLTSTWRQNWGGGAALYVTPTQESGGPLSPGPPRIAATETGNVLQSLMNNQQTNKKLNIFGSLGGVRSLSPTKLGMLTEDLEHVLAPENVLGSDVQFHH